VIWYTEVEFSAVSNEAYEPDAAAGANSPGNRSSVNGDITLCENTLYARSPEPLSVTGNPLQHNVRKEPGAWAFLTFFCFIDRWVICQVVNCIYQQFFSELSQAYCKWQFLAVSHVLSRLKRLFVATFLNIILQFFGKYQSLFVCIYENTIWAKVWFFLSGGLLCTYLQTENLIVFARIPVEKINMKFMCCATIYILNLFDLKIIMQPATVLCAWVALRALCVRLVGFLKMEQKVRKTKTNGVSVCQGRSSKDQQSRSRKGKIVRVYWRVPSSLLFVRCFQCQSDWCWTPGLMRTSTRKFASRRWSRRLIILADRHRTMCRATVPWRLVPLPTDNWHRARLKAYTATRCKTSPWSTKASTEMPPNVPSLLLATATGTCQVGALSSSCRCTGIVLLRQ